MTEVLEEHLNTIGGLRTLSSTSFHGAATVVAEFELERDLDQATQDVRDKVARARWELPKELEPPVVDKINMANRPILWIPINSDRPAVETRRQRCYFDGGSHEVPVHERAQLRPGDTIGGPALVFDAYTACVVEPGWTARVDGAGALVLRREAGAVRRGGESRPPDVVRRELFTNRFLSIARQMGRMLERTALSTNVKERLDFSCALLDADGELVVHAPHMPVHLGSLGLCVRAVRDAVAMAPGDVVVTNHPAFGGSHLPDITVVTPVFGRGGLLGYVASRAHHAEIGGTRPGSMPPLAKSLAEEGVVLAPAHLIRAGEARFAEIERQLAEAPYPSRAIGDNLADLRAAVAANHRGATALGALAEAHGDEVIAREMAAIKARAEALARRALLGLSGGPYQAKERLDDGSPICVTIDLAGDRAVIDFSG
ncbi:MAG: hydantoinase B/oxoprolinase family protein, partial [Planctomycetes bacterium]|nr:hydantoinase B/oxoprolinase family protein [Planctomycetota bacterium]